MTDRLLEAMGRAVRDSHVEPEPASLPLLVTIAQRMYAIFTDGAAELTDDSELDNTTLNAIGFTASRYGVLGVRELTAMVAAGVPFREDVTAELPASHRQAVLEALREPPTAPDYWPGPLGYSVALHKAVTAAEAADDGSDARRFYAIGLRVAAGLYGLPDGVAPANRRAAADDLPPIRRVLFGDEPPPEELVRYRMLCGELDLMPVFVIKGKDRLAPAAVAAYRDLCAAAGLSGQADQVQHAVTEIIGWQARHPRKVQTPDHAHVPVGG